MSLTLVLGGARSGKSAFAQGAAEICARTRGIAPVMIVTAQAFDAEMEERIARHQADRRDGAWTTLEATHDLVGTLRGLPPGAVAVVDCLTLWLTNLMLADRDLSSAAAELVAAASAFDGELWLVSKEVGWGVVPDNALARRFRDEAGRLHKALARVADRVELVAAGLSLRMK